MLIKPGYRTSEFWFTLVSFIFSGLYLIGVLKENEHKEELIQIVSHAVESIILISGQVFILQKYIKGRNEVKKVVSGHQKTVYIEESGIDGNDQATNNVPSRKKRSTNKRVRSKTKKSSSK